METTSDLHIYLPDSLSLPEAAILFMGPIFPVPSRSLTSSQMCKEAHVRGPYINDEELEMSCGALFSFFEIMSHYHCAALTILNSRR